MLNYGLLSSLNKFLTKKNSDEYMVSISIITTLSQYLMAGKYFTNYV